MAYKKSNPNGQATMANSEPVVLASDQSVIPVSDNSGSLTVDNAGLTELAAAINASSQMDVNIAASGATVPVSNAGLTALNGAISGTEVQVDVLTLPAIPAGNNNIGDVDIASIAAGDNNIGNVDVVTLPSIPAGTNNIGDVDVLSVPAPLSTTGGGTEATALRVTVASDSTGVLSIDDNGGAITVDNAGTFAVQVDGSALTALQVIDNPVLVDDAAFTPATSSVMMAGFEADEASTDSVDEGDAGAARMTLDRKLIVTPQPHTTGGLSIFRSIDLDETEEEVKASAGSVYAMWVTNTATSTRFIKFYNATAANVTVGTTTPVITIGIPGNTSDDISGNFGPGGIGVSFDTAISVAATTGVADNDTGAPGANEVIVNIFYK